MDGEPGDDAGARTRRTRHWLLDLPLSKLRRLGLVLVLAGAALFGGLDTVDTAVTQFDPGKPFGDGQFTVTLQRAALVPEVRAGTRTLAPAKPDRRYLAIVTEIRNDGTVPGNLDGELDLRDQPDKEFVGVFRLADGTRLIRLGPGLTEQVAFTWALPENAVTAGDSVTVRVWKKKYTELMVTYGQAWIDSLTDYGQVTVPVQVQS